MQITSFIKFIFPGDAFPQLSTDPISRGMVSVAATDGCSCQGSRGEREWQFRAGPRPRSHAEMGATFTDLAMLQGCNVHVQRDTGQAGTGFRHR